MANEARCSQLLAGFIPLAASVGYCACVPGVLERSSKLSNGLPATFEGWVGALWKPFQTPSARLPGVGGPWGPFQPLYGHYWGAGDLQEAFWPASHLVRGVRVHGEAILGHRKAFLVWRGRFQGGVGLPDVLGPGLGGTPGLLVRF